MKTNLILLAVIVSMTLSVPVFGADKVVVIPLNSKKAAGSDAQVQYNDGGQLAGAANLFYNKNEGSLGVGTVDPKRTLHVRGGWPAQFEATAHGNSAVLDFNHPNITSGNFSRLNWRSDNSAGSNEQFAAIDVFYDDKTSGGEEAAMRFQTRLAGNWKEALWLKWGRVGIGTDSPGFNLDVQKDNQYTTAARMYSSYDGSHTTVLRLQVGRDTPDATNNFIEFRAGTGAGTVIAAIDGNGSGGVTYKTTGSDFAEYLPLARSSEIIEAGDIVGLTGRYISKNILPGSQVRVISSAPGVLGNYPGEEREHLFRKVAFLGQVPVKVRGPVHRGDFIIPSGKNDGIGIAVSPETLTPDRYGHIVGVAWQDWEREAPGMVNAEIGLHAAIRLLGEQTLRRERQMAKIISNMDAMQARLEKLEGMVAETGAENPQDFFSPRLAVMGGRND